MWLQKICRTKRDVVGLMICVAVEAEKYRYVPYFQKRWNRFGVLSLVPFIWSRYSEKHSALHSAYLTWTTNASWTEWTREQQREKMSDIINYSPVPWLSAPQPLHHPLPILNNANNEAFSYQHSSSISFVPYSHPMYSMATSTSLESNAVAVLEGLLGKEQTLCLQVCFPNLLRPFFPCHNIYLLLINLFILNDSCTIYLTTRVVHSC